MKTKICLIWHNCYPWDIRIEKFIRSLTEANYEISIICRWQEGYKKEDVISNVAIYRIVPPNWIKKNILTFPLYFNPIWMLSMKKILSRIQPDLIIVRDIPLGMLAARLSIKMGIPTILDMAENYPAALKAYNNIIYKPFLIHNAFLPKYYEKKCLQLMSHVLVVSEEQKERLIKIGTNRAKVSIIMNTPDLNYYASLIAENNERQYNSNRNIKLIYVGMIDSHRGVDILIEGLALAIKILPNLSLKLIGSGTEMERIRALSKKLGVCNHIEFTNWVPFEEIPSHIQSSDIGVIPHLKSEHTDTTIPNKLFDYMAFGKPIISSNLNPVAKIVKEIGCGAIFESGNPNDLAQKIIDTVNNNKISLTGNKGLNAAKIKFNWNKDKSILLETISNILKKRILL